MRDIMLVLHFIGLAMGIGTSFAFLFLGLAGSRMEAEEAKKFRLNTFVLSRMGHIGLALLVISGGYLMTPYWGMLTSSPALMIKLLLVIVLGALIGIIGSEIKKARTGNPEAHLTKIEMLGKIAVPVGIIIVVLAVFVFH